MTKQILEISKFICSAHSFRAAKIKKALDALREFLLYLAEYEIHQDFTVTLMFEKGHLLGARLEMNEPLGFSSLFEGLEFLDLRAHVKKILKEIGTEKTSYEKFIDDLDRNGTQALSRLVQMVVKKFNEDLNPVSTTKSFRSIVLSNYDDGNVNRNRWRLISPSRAASEDYSGPEVEDGSEFWSELYSKSLLDYVTINSEVCAELDFSTESKSFKRKIWEYTCSIATIIFPDFLLKGFGVKTQAAIMAWREKVTMCIIIAVLCVSMLFYVIVLPWMLCPDQKLLSITEFKELSKTSPHCIINGMIFDLSPLLISHVNNGASPRHILNCSGKDVSDLFPSAASPRGENKLSSLHKASLRMQIIRNSKGRKSVKPQQTPEKLASQSVEKTVNEQNKPKNPQNNIAKPTGIMPANTKGTEFVHSFKEYDRLLERCSRIHVGYSRKEVEVENSQGRKLVVVNGMVIDLVGLEKLSETNPVLWRRLVESYAQNISLFVKISEQDEVIMMKNFVGFFDSRRSIPCKVASFVLIGSSLFLVLVMLLKIVAALQLPNRKKSKYSESFVIIQVPCFTENEESLIKTINSIALLQIEDSQKLLFVIADGLIMGEGNDRTTPNILLDIFGIDLEEFEVQEPHYYSSIGPDYLGENYGKVFSGIYETAGQRLPYVLVVKVGNSVDDNGNRGKRDSQLILLNFLNKLHFGEMLEALEMQIYEHVQMNIGIDPKFYEYIMMVDADTEVRSDALHHMLRDFAGDPKIMGLCGETRITNELASFVTMIQVYEYFVSHNLTKAFESIFGSVTCLPGCFCIYRLKTVTEHGNVPLIIDHCILEQYSRRDLHTLHSKNLLCLGEDRFLTTLMLQNFPNLKLKFTPEAKCKTWAPDTWRIFLSQRRRWINSTIHNLFELMFVRNLCGLCCFSLRFMVFIDLLGTIVMPASTVYIFFLIHQSMQYRTAPMISLALMAAVYGIQSILFIKNRQWQYIGWLSLYLISLPVTGLLIPIYAYWHLDDFSWGETRKLFSSSEKTHA